MKTEMNPCSIVKATSSHALTLKLRESDLREVNLLAPGQDPSAVLCALLERSTQAWAALDGDEVIAIGGYAVEGQWVQVWLLASEASQRHRTQLLNRCKLVVADLLGEYPRHVVGAHVNRDNMRAFAFLMDAGAIVTNSPGRAEFDFFFFPRVQHDR